MLDAYGGIHAAGGAPPVTVTYYASGFDSVRDLVLRADGSGYVLDLFGGIHPFGGAPAPTAGPYWSGWDIARSIVVTVDTAVGVGGYVLDGWGGTHPFATGLAVPPAALPNTWWEPGDENKSLQMDGPASGWVVTKHGAVHAFNAPAVDDPTYSYALDATAAAHIEPDGHGFLLQRDGTTKALVPQQVNDPQSDPDHQPAQNRPVSPPIATYVQPVGYTDVEIPMPPVPADVIDVSPILQSTQVINTEAFVAWALDHTIDGQEWNPSGYVRMRNDCTNFVSQALDYAGWHEVGGPGLSRDFVKTKKWFFPYNKPVYRGRYSFTWAVANDFALMLAATEWAKPIVNWSKVKEGDIVQIDDGNGRVFHSMIVTYRAPGSTGKNGIGVTYHESATGVDFENRAIVDIEAAVAAQRRTTPDSVVFYVWRPWSVAI